MYLSLLAFGAYCGLPARCGALGIGPIDGTFALQVRQQEGEGHENVLRREVPRLAAEGIYTYTAELSFVIAGFDYSSLSSDSTAVANFTDLLTRECCKNFTENVNNYTYDCQVTLSASQPVAGVLVGISIPQIFDQSAAEAVAAELASYESDMVNTMAGPRANMLRIPPFSAHHNGQAVAIQNFAVWSLASGSDDPHLTSVTGKKFDVKIPGSYVLLRAPSDQRLPAKFELNATLEASVGSPCGLYIKRVDLGGEWLGDQVVSVLPLQRNVEGQNGAGNITLRPFSVRLQEAEGDTFRVKEGQYKQWGDIGKRGRRLSGRVRLVPLWRQVFADAGRPQEAQAFQFRIRGDGAKQDATLEASQAAHQALNIRAFGLRSLGFEHLGGLLGTEEHNRSLEHLADACKAFRMRSRQSIPMSPSGLSMAASWDVPQ